MDRLTFAFMVTPGETDREALMLAESIRAFAGDFRDGGIQVMIPEIETQLAAATRAQFESLSVRIARFPINRDLLEFPFAAKVLAAAAAESLTAGQTGTLAWMDVDSLVTGDPAELVLGTEEQFAYRPVDHTLIGSLWDQEIDGFWQLIYAHCKVDPERLWPMIATVDERRIRPYFNGGIVVVRPEKGLLGAWRDAFDELHRREVFREFYARDRTYRSFIHQAALAGTVLGALEPAAMRELSPRVAYPLHMQADYPPERRVERLDDLVTTRYDVFFGDPDWERKLPAGDALRDWIGERRRG
jgi:hypothetical protein